MMNWDGFSFGFPWVLIVLPIVIFYQYRQFKASANTSPTASGVYVPFLLLERKHLLSKKSGVFGGFLMLFLACLVSIFLVLALARPQLALDQTYVPQESRYIMLSLDLSKSMSSADVVWKGRSLNRLQAAKIAIDSFVKRLESDRLGLVVFGDEAYLITPPTLDHQTLLTHLMDAQIGMAGKRTAIGDAIVLSLKHLKDLPLKSRTIILLTDGSNTAGNLEPSRAAEIAKELGVKVYTIGLGGRSQSFLSVLGFYGGSVEYDEVLLKEIAETTGGQFYKADGVESLTDIYKKINELEYIEVQDQQYRIVRELYYYPLLLSFVCLFMWLFFRLRYV